jgi:BolA family transcriptional regulator, general stress-responsive regulator
MVGDGPSDKRTRPLVSVRGIGVDGTGEGGACSGAKEIITVMALMKDRIAEKLRAAFDPATLEVIDESHHHAGHAGARPGGETHYRIRIAAPAFAAKSRVEIHRAINTALADELEGGVHALAIEARAV